MLKISMCNWSANIEERELYQNCSWRKIAEQFQKLTYSKKFNKHQAQWLKENHTPLYHNQRENLGNNQRIKRCYLQQCKVKSLAEL